MTIPTFFNGSEQHGLYSQAGTQVVGDCDERADTRWGNCRVDYRGLHPVTCKRCKAVRERRTRAAINEAHDVRRMRHAAGIAMVFTGTDDDVA